MDPASKDIYHQDAPPPLARRRKRWMTSRSAAGAAGAPPPASTTYTQAAAGRGQRPDPGLHHDHRVRTRRRRSDHSPQVATMNRALWMAVTAVVLLYLMVLAVYVVLGRTQAKQKPVAVAAKAKEAARTATAPLATADGARPIEDDIRAWKNARRFTTEGAAAAAAGQVEAGMAKLRAALEQSPDMTRARLELARSLVTTKQFQEAEALLRQVLAADPESAEARMALAATYIALGQPAGALALARWELDSDPYSATAHDLAATALLSLGEPAEAITHLRRLVSLNRDDLIPQNNLGMAYLQVKDYRSALATFREVLKSDPGNSAAYYNIAVSHARQGQALDAVNILREASRKFGSTFVLTWTQSTDFDNIRGDGLFSRFVDSGAVTSEAETVEAEAVEADAAVPAPPAP